ncbi:fused MFS/spermidine synthase [Isoptericola sp. b441]|uniref:Fused MFS/spermidine synthase n=1 Tax=Actinotalea lenta TaxID=3064654 RepID=A0ABT9DDM1_9CELL|nr:fused MFS/spermidine synthase [Isoptericola sp. b441]MDO8107413.1 fused MFS/spermidine synthase [Isoptericola sp. b441]
MPSRRHRATRALLPVEAVPIATGSAQLVVDAERPELVTLLVNGVPSSCLDLDDPRYLEFEYHQQMAAVVDLLPPGPLRALHLGAGACTFPRWLDSVRPGSHQLAVDVDDVLVRRVRQWFELPRSPALRVRAADALTTLSGMAERSWDLVVRDVFAGDATPRELTTRSAAEQVRRVLRPEGLYLVNCVDRPPLPLARAEAATLAEAVGPVMVVAEPAVLRGRRYGNVVLAAGGPGFDLGRLARALRVLAVPARLLDPGESADFARSARPIE